LPRAGALVGWVRALIRRFANKRELQGCDRAEFDQIASDLKLSPPELYAICAGNSIPADLLNKRLAKFGLSPKGVQARHPTERSVSLPIGPSCC
jgi:hypothetical protein